MLLVSLGLGALLTFREPTERIVYVDRPATHQEPSAAPRFGVLSGDAEPRLAAAHGSVDASYLMLRDQVLRLGVKALNAPSDETGGSRHSDDRNRALLNQLLGS